MIRKRFVDGEIYIQIQNRSAADASQLPAVNDHLMELLIMIDACRRVGRLRQ